MTSNQRDCLHKQIEERSKSMTAVADDMQYGHQGCCNSAGLCKASFLEEEIMQVKKKEEICQEVN